MFSILTTIVLGWALLLLYYLKEGGHTMLLGSAINLRSALTTAAAGAKMESAADAPKPTLASPPPTSATKASDAAAAPPAATSRDPGHVHVIFSTDCEFYQDWQTLVLFQSANRVGQKGPITRIASGCSEEKKARLVELYGKLYPPERQFSAHFTPDFKHDSKTNRKCKANLKRGLPAARGALA